MHIDSKRTRFRRSANLWDGRRVLQLVKLEWGGFVADVAVLRVFKVYLDVGNERIVDGGGNRIDSRRVRGRNRFEVNAVEICGERVVHRFGPKGA